MPLDPLVSPCTQHDSCRATRRTVLASMVADLDDCRDRLTDEVNHTALAERAADRFDHGEWLDDEQHPVWDLALKADPACSS